MLLHSGTRIIALFRPEVLGHAIDARSARGHSEFLRWTAMAKGRLVAVEKNFDFANAACIVLGRMMVDLSQRSSSIGLGARSSEKLPQPERRVRQAPHPRRCTPGSDNLQAPFFSTHRHECGPCTADSKRTPKIRMLLGDDEAQGTAGRTVCQQAHA